MLNNDSSNTKPYSNAHTYVYPPSHFPHLCCVVWVFDFVVDFVFVCIKHESYILTLRIRGFMNLPHHMNKQFGEKPMITIEFPRNL